MKASLDNLFIIMEADSFLTQAETALKSKGEDCIASELLKLQQDCGEQISRRFEEPGEIAHGPISASLDASYEPVTQKRLENTLQKIREALPSDLSANMTDLMSKLGIAEPETCSSAVVIKNNSVGVELNRD